MKDGALALEGQKIEEKTLGKPRRKITRKYWFGWAGSYGTLKKE